MPGQNIREPRRGAENERDEADELGFLAQQREQASPSAQSGKKIVKGGEGCVWIVGGRELLNDDGHEFVEIFAGLLAAQGAIDRAVPTAHCCIDLTGLTKAKFGQPIERRTGACDRTSKR